MPNVCVEVCCWNIHFLAVLWRKKYLFSFWILLPQLVEIAYSRLGVSEVCAVCFLISMNLTLETTALETSSDCPEFTRCTSSMAMSFHQCEIH